MILAIDAGNTLLKWGLHKDGAWVAQGAVSHPDIVRLWEVWKPYGAPQAIMISNVSGEKVRSALSVLLSRFRVAVQWVTATAEQCGVKNGYQTPAQLGADRWASLIAARRLHAGACLVVMAGTATTVDALSPSGQFLGGLIVPGLRLMIESLSTRTAGIRPEQGEYALFPNNTRDAVYSGALNALIGCIEHMRDVMLTSGHGEPICILSGGAAAALQDHINMPVHRVDDLVLTGLVAMAQA
jgi:type III pantothenate kinase